jgi:glutaredoxin 3
MIIIYTKDHCPYCILAKQLLTRLEASYEEINVSGDPEAFEELKNRSKLLTVPQIFVDDTCLGGYTDIA